MAKFVLQYNYFDINGETKQHIFATAVGIKFAPWYACIFMDQVESEFLKTQIQQPLVWFIGDNRQTGTIYWQIKTISCWF